MSAAPVTGRRWSQGLTGAALLVAVITVVSRVLGFGRWLVFQDAVGTSCLSSAYLTANALPNVVFEVVAGGALAGAVVPLIAAARERDDANVGRLVSALLTWSMLVLIPTSILCLVLARPLMAALLRDPNGCDGTQVVRVAASMFLIFTPQIALYGVAVVCSGVLQAHRRFLAAAAAPLLSSVVVVATYAIVAGVWSGDRNDLGALPRDVRLGLAGGTTAGVLTLATVVAVPLMSLRLGLRPTLRFPGNGASRARRLALAGLAGLLAQQIAALSVLAVANLDRGALAVYVYAWAVYLLPYAVLAVPIATSAFPALAADVGRGDEDGYARTLASSTRLVVISAGIGIALLVATAVPVSRTFPFGADDVPASYLGWALVAFAPGLLGYALLAHLGRAAYARGQARAVGVAAVAGWGVVALLSAVVGPLVEPQWRVTALGVANSVGMTVAGILLLATVHRSSGPAALTGVTRATAASLLAVVPGAGVGLVASSWVSGEGHLENALLTCAIAAVALVVFLGALACMDRRDLRSLLDRVNRRRQPV